MLGLGLAVTAIFPAYAQTMQDIQNATQQSEQIQREQEIRRQEQINRDEQSANPPTKLEAPAPAKPASAEDEFCRDINKITIWGAYHLKTSLKNRIIKPYLNRCLKVVDIEKLLADITRIYIDKGYATARAYIPAQDLSTGRLEITVVEGKIVEMQLNENGTVSPETLSLKGAFPGVKGKIMDLADFEQGIDQLNRLQSNRVTMDIKPGKKPGESIVVINNQPTKPWHLNFGLDDYGVRSTGRSQASATASVDSLLGLNEFVSYTRRESLPLRGDEKNSTSNNVFFSIPYGYTTLSAGYSNSDYRSVLNTTGGTLQLTGDSYNVFGKIENTVYRVRTDKLNISSTLTAKSFSNFLAGQKLTVSSRRLAVLDVDADYSTVLGGGFASIGLGYSRGLDIFNALDDAPAIPSGEVAHAQFDKLRLTASYMKPFALWTQPMSISSQLTGQLTNKALYGSEQLSIGSIYTVRGFYDAGLANDNGAYIRNDLSLSHVIGEIADGVPAVARPYLGLDAGAVKGHMQKSPNGVLVGAAAGVGLSAGPVYFDIYTSHGLISPDLIQDEGFMSFGRFSVTF